MRQHTRVRAINVAFSFYFLKLITLTSFTAVSKANEEFDDRPRLSSSNGHLFITSARDRNISFVTTGESYVNVNDVDLVHLIFKVKEATNAVSFQSMLFNSLEQRVANVLRMENDIDRRISVLESSLKNVSNDMSLVDKKGRPLGKRVEQLEKKVRNLNILLTTNECQSNPCQNGGTCFDQFNSFQCKCPEQWTGFNCEVDVDECARFYHTGLGCQNGAICRNKPGSYECECAQGWFGIHCTTRVNECAKAASNFELCGHGTCENQPTASRGFTCHCDQGWKAELNSPACTVDINECETNDHRCSRSPPVKCQNLPGRYTCGPCPRGYEGDGFWCVDIDECAINNGGCSVSPRVHCFNTMGSRSCGPCPAGYSGDGINCVAISGGVCAVQNGGCSPNAFCTTGGQNIVLCTCKEGYTGIGIGPNGCTAIILSNACYSNPCVHGACILVNQTSYTCQCDPAYTGEKCNVKKDACYSIPCWHNGTCINSAEYDYLCYCKKGYKGRNCDEIAEECGGEYLSPAGVISYPLSNSWHNSSSGGLTCEWSIYMNDTSKIFNITFDYVKITKNSACERNYLQIRDDGVDPNIFKGCDSFPKSVFSQSNRVKIMMVTNSASTPSFSLNYTSLTPDCGGLLNANSMKALDYRGLLPLSKQHRDCDWKFIALPGKKIQFRFYAMNLPGELCENYLEIRDGLDVNSVLLQKYCNTLISSPVTTSSSEAFLRFHYSGHKKTSNPSFQLFYSAIEGIPGCGALLTDPTGEIQYSASMDEVSEELHCLWKIQLPHGQRIRLNFTSFKIQRCYGGGNKLEIRDGDTTESPLLARYCGSDKPSLPILSGKNEMTIYLKLTNDAAKFHASYDSPCGGVFTKESGTISSPYYPFPYRNAATCIYIIAFPPGKAVVLDILEVDVGTPDVSNSGSNLCGGDYLMIRDGDNENSTHIKTVCSRSNKVSEKIISTHNYLYLMYNIETIQNSFRGFTASYSSVDVSCGGIYKQPSGIIQMPSSGEEIYPHNAKCTWIISAPLGYMVQLTFLKFDLEYGFNCRRDFVQLYDNSTEGNATHLGTFCHNRIPPVTSTMGNIMTIIFKSDFSEAMGGFQAAYVTRNASNTCGQSISGSSGLVKSPNYPRDYTNNLDCFWTITAPFGQQITLNITDFLLEKGLHCSQDYLEIRDGSFSSSPLIGKYCGTTHPGVIVSTSNKVFLKFHSDNSVTKKGFLLYWDASTSGCGGTLRGVSGHISSPNMEDSFDRRYECSWKIIVARGNVVQINILDLDLYNAVLGPMACLYNYVEFFDGESSNAKSLAKLCTLGHVSTLQSTGNIMYIKSKMKSHRGFQLKYITACNLTLNAGYGGVLESPNFPQSPTFDYICNWKIVAARGHNISLIFTHFNLVVDRPSYWRILPHSNTNNNTCSDSNYVKVGEGSFFNLRASLGKFCGASVPPVITTSRNVAYIDYVFKYLQAQHNYKGFRMEWYIEGCGGILKKPKGIITSPNYPNSYPNSVMCDWNIQLDYSHSIQVTLDRYNLENRANCSADYIMIFAGKDDTAPLVNKFCNKQDTPVVYTITSNNALIRFNSDDSINGGAFKMEYKAIDLLCGGKMMSLSGNIHTRNYPNNYEAGDHCEWRIEVPPTYLINLTFIDFSTRKSTQFLSPSDFVTVYDGDVENNNRTLLHFAGDYLPQPNTFISSTNKLLVTFDSNKKSRQAKGFQAHYEIACGARIVTNGSGVIPYSNTVHSYFEYHNCSWIIKADMPDSKVSLVVTHLDIHASNASNCVDGFRLVIIDGEDADDPILSSLCGYKVPPTIFSTGSTLRIELRTFSLDDVRSIFKIHTTRATFSATYYTYATACGGNLTSLEGEFSSPKYPDAYEPNSDCVWYIRTSPGNRISLNFNSMDIEGGESCNDDYVEIRENSATGHLLNLYCGNAIPPVMTYGDSLWIKFRSNSDSRRTATGFLAHYTLLHGNDIMRQTSGKIASPFYPIPFKEMGTFTWRVTVAARMRIKVSFDEIFIFDTNDDCSSAYLQVFDGYDSDAPILATLCDSRRHVSHVTSTGNVILVKFYSDTSEVENFFLISWQQEDMELTPDPERERSTEPKSIPLMITCGENITLGYGVSGNTSYLIKSPGYPNGYEGRLNCVWNINTSPENHVEFYFRDIDLEVLDSLHICYGDYVIIYSVIPNEEKKYMNAYCRKVEGNEPITSPRNMMIKFITDSSGNKTGFSGKAYVKCGGILSGPDGVLETSSIPDIGIVSCQWNISVKTGRTINVEFVAFNITAESTSDTGPVCKNNYIILRNGENGDSPYLGTGKYCGALPKPMETTGNKLYIKYKALRDNTNSQNFKMIYKEVSMDCGGDIMLTNNVPFFTITSPNYPNIPPPYTECIWVIQAPLGDKITVDVTDVDLHSTTNCVWEYIEARDGAHANSKLVDRFCEHPTNVIESTGNFLYLKYYTSLEEPNNGFQANISTSACGGTRRGMNGLIHSPKYPDNYPQNFSCDHRIVAPENVFLTITLIQNNLHWSSVVEDHYDRITIHEILPPNNTKREVGIFKKRTKDDVSVKSFNTTTNEAIISFQSYSHWGTLSPMNFVIKFTANFMDCGGILESPSGIISYRSSKKDFGVCKWTIKAPIGRRVTVEILEAFLPIVDDIPKILHDDLTRENLHFYCNSFRSWIMAIPSSTNGDSISRFVKSSSNKMDIEYYFLSVSGGFKLRYYTSEPAVCGGILSESSGNLTLRINNKTQSSPCCCNWEIRVQSKGFNKTVAIKVYGKYGFLNEYECYKRSGLSLFISNQDEEYPVEKHFCHEIKQPPYLLLMPFKKIFISAFLVEDEMENNLIYSVSDCGGILRDPSNRIVMNSYPADTYCAWSIRYPVGTDIQIKFNKLDMNSDCEKNVLNIYNGGHVTSPLLKSICGNIKPEDIKTKSHQLWIEFHSKIASRNETILDMIVSIEESGCGGLYYGINGILTSPGYSNHVQQYPNNVECTWNLETHAGYHILANFTDRFFIEDSPNCSNDFVQMFNYEELDDIWTSLGKFCGRNAPHSVSSASHKMKVLFRTNAITQGDGFKLIWSSECGGIATSKEGFIKSPNYPLLYPSNITCNYTILAPGKIIQMEFVHFDLEGEYERERQHCGADNVTILRENPYTTAMLSLHTEYSSKYEYMHAIGTYCGRNEIAPIRARNVAVILFSSDENYEKTGFLIRYTVSICGGNITTPTTISSPAESNSLYFPSLACTWIIMAPKNKSILLRFSSFELEGRDCQYDMVNIWEGLNKSTDALIGTYCDNMNHNPPIVKTLNNSMIVEFISDKTSHFRGFSADIMFKDGSSAGCGGSYHMKSFRNFTINSPPLTNIDMCTWTLTTNSDNILKIKLIQFENQCHYSDCSNCNHLILKDGPFDKSATLENVCESTSSRIFLTTKNSVTISYYFRNLTLNTKFSLTVETAKSLCGISQRFITNKTVELMSYGWPNKTTGVVHCKWQLNFSNPNSDNFVIIHIDDLELEETPTCARDKLELTSYLDNSPTISALCSKNHASDFYLFGDWFEVSFVTSSNNSMNIKKRFKLSFRVSDCNVTYIREQGFIIAKYGVTPCTTLIKSPKPNTTISLYLQSGADIPEDIQEGCNSSKIMIYDGESRNSTLLSSVCTPKTNPVFSSGPNLFIYLGAAASSNYFEHPILYTTTDKGPGCGGKIFNRSGKFTSPMYPNSYRNNAVCRWDVSVPKPNNIRINFLHFNVGSVQTCSTDFLEIYSYDPFQKTEMFYSKYCGGDHPSVFIGTTGSVVIKYTTSVNNQGTGWIISFTGASSSNDNDDAYGYVEEFRLT